MSKARTSPRNAFTNQPARRFTSGLSSVMASTASQSLARSMVPAGATRPGRLAPPRADVGATTAATVGLPLPSGGSNAICPLVICNLGVTILNAPYAYAGSTADFRFALDFAKASGPGDPSVRALTGGPPPAASFPTTAIPVAGITIVGGKVPLTSNPASPLTIQIRDFLTGGATPLDIDISVSIGTGGIVGANYIAANPTMAAGEWGFMMHIPFTTKGVSTVQMNPACVVATQRGLAPSVTVSGSNVELSATLLCGNNPLTGDVTRALDYYE